MAANDPYGIVAHLARTQEKLLQGLEDITEEEALVRPQSLAPIVWQAGHVALVDLRAATRAGLDVVNPEVLGPVFAAGTGTGAAGYPPLDEVKEWLGEAWRAIESLAGLPPDREVKGSKLYETAGQALSFLLYHRGYHLGKLATLRALLGKPRLFG